MRLNNLSYRILYLFLIFLFWGCEEKFRVRPYPDPYAQLFRSKGISCVVVYDSEYPLNVDSLFLDDYGNIVRRKRVASDERYCFNELFFPTRVMKIDEFSSNYVIVYQNSDEKKEWIQKWIKVKGYKWEYDTMDFLVQQSKSLQLNFDSEGRLLEEKDSLLNRITRYSYRDSLLVSKEIYDYRKDRVVNTVRYIYNENNYLSQIEEYTGKFLELHHFVSNEGLPDSTVLKGEIILKYKYIYSHVSLPNGL